jgi:hypothetical protein
MKNTQQDMNVARQRRKLTSLIDHVSDPGEVRYLTWLVELFDDAVAHGLPQPATEFIPMYHEEFGR